MKSNAEIVREKYGIEPGVDDLEDFDSGEILDGIEVEFEHTDDPAEALKIALDHLREIPDYYTRLIAMEEDALEKAGGRRDLTKLVKKQIVDKRGHRTTVWVKRGETPAVEEKKAHGVDLPEKEKKPEAAAMTVASVLNDDWHDKHFRDSIERGLKPYGAAEEKEDRDYFRKTFENFTDKQIDDIIASKKDTRGEAGQAAAVRIVEENAKKEFDKAAEWAKKHGVDKSFLNIKKYIAQSEREFLEPSDGDDEGAPPLDIFLERKQASGGVLYAHLIVHPGDKYPELFDYPDDDVETEEEKEFADMIASLTSDPEEIVTLYGAHTADFINEIKKTGVIPKGVFFSPNKAVAEAYAGRPGREVLSIRARRGDFLGQSGHDWHTSRETKIVDPASPNIYKAETWSGHKLHGRRLFRGLDISIENRAGSYREWPGGRTKMHYPYGYIRRTAGADGDHVDCYVGPYEDAPEVYVVRQLDPKTGEFDEDKVFLGFMSEGAAKSAFFQHRTDGPDAFGGIKAFPFDEFKGKVLATMHKNDPGMIKAVPTDVDRGGFIGMAVALVKAIGGRKDITKLIKKQITNKKGVRQTVYVKREDAPKETKKSIFDRIAAALNLPRVSDVVPEVKAKFAVAGPTFGIEAGVFEDHFLEYWRHKAFWDARFSGRPEKVKAEKKPRAGKKKKARGESSPKAPAKYRADVMRWIAEQYGPKKKTEPGKDNFETMPEAVPEPGEKKPAGEPREKPARAPKKTRPKPAGAPETPDDEKPQFVDVGEHIGGSKKDIRALVRELEADKEKSVSLDDAVALEAEGLAEAFVTRDRQIGTRKNFALSMYRAGADPAAVALSWWFLSKIDGPAKQTPEARQNFIVACNRLMEAVSLWKTPDDARAGMRAIFEEFHGFMMSPEDQKILSDKRAEYNRVRGALQDYANDIWKESGYDTRRFNREKEKDPKFNALYNDMRNAQRDIDNFQKQAKASYEAKNGTPVWKSLGKKFEKEMGRVSYTPELRIHPKSGFLKKIDDYAKKAVEYNWDKFGVGESGEEIKKEKKKNGEAAEEKPRRWSREVPEEVERESPVKVGKGYDSKKLLDDFGLRGIEYGNYVDNESAKQHTQSCAEAFMDLAHILGVSPKDVSLKGRLAVAFGARGSGNALAHYEAVRKVINITKNRGGGSLAHEWGHALDNILAVVASGGKWGGDKAITNDDVKGKSALEVSDTIPTRSMAFFTEHYGNREEFPGLSPELEAAFDDVSRAMEYSESPISRKFKFDVYEKKNKYRKSFYPGSFLRQHVDGAEEAFRGIYNGEESRKIETRLFDELAGNTDQIKKIIQKKFDELHEKSISTLSRMKGYYRGEDPKLFFDVAGEYHRACLEFVNKFMGMLYNKDRLKPELVESLKKGAPVLIKALPVMERDGKQLYESAYLSTAKEMGEYWKRPVELFARAFEAYVSDRLDESGMKNSYLSSGNRESDVSKYAAGWQEKTGFQYSVYPRGEDRKRVKAAFDRFFELMKKESVLQKAISLYNQMDLAK